MLKENNSNLKELLSNIDSTVSDKFVLSVLHDLQNRSDWDKLLCTICTWCETEFSIVNTAKILNIHKNTLLYRLTRIKQISGFNLRIFKDSITLYIAVKVNILNNKGKNK